MPEIRPQSGLEHGIIQCPLCEFPANFSLWYAARDFFHCTQCDLIFVPVAQHLDIAAERARYEQHQNSLENAGYVDNLQTIVDLLHLHAPSAKRILDYGCGPSPVLVELLRRDGFDATGYDPIFAPDADLSTPFDAIVCVETVEHFRCPGDSWADLLALVRTGNCLIVQTRFHTGPASLNGWWYARDKTHIAFHSHRTLDWMCSRSQLALAYRDATLAVMQRWS